MMELRRNENNQVLVPRLEVAEGINARSKGLLGRSDLAADAGLWIHRCNSIHTWFMRFAIDCVFVDRELRVVAVKENVGPWRMTWPAWGASSVVEVKAGVARTWNLKVGEKLDVGAART